MNKHSDIVIIGGGLAGLTACIHLLQNGFSVTLFEKNEFPKHKVCGEFISNEVWEYFQELELDIESLGPTHINKTLLSTVSGQSITSKLPLGGFGISRYTLDQYLYQKAIALGGKLIQDSIINVVYDKDFFTISSQSSETFTAKIVLGAFGKRSNLDKKWNRKFIQQKSPWLAIKAHYKLDFPDDLVALHNFKGGYCGVSKVENDTVNVCYLVQYNSFKKYKNIDDFQEQVVFKNEHLKEVFTKGNALFDKPLTISQISFENKPKIENHILMIGDSAGLIHPLCGNGMAMAIHSAKIASECVTDYLQNTISRTTLEATYVSIWNKTFKKRLQFGKILSKILLNSYLSNGVLKIVLWFPFLLPMLIKKTHGKPIN